MTGLLLGILLARTVSGLVAQLAGWRAIYWLSAALMVVLRRRPVAGPPRRGPTARTALPAAWWPPRCASWWTSRCCAGGPGTGRAPSPVSACCGRPSPSCSPGAPYHYSSAVIGLFGLVGAAGILAANLAGKLADADRSPASTLVAGVLLVGSFGLLWFGRRSLAALIVGIVVLDIGTQGMQITNQAIIYALRPDARSRINSAYMVCYFIGGAVGSVTAGVVFGEHGWSGVCLLGAGFGALPSTGTSGRVRRWSAGVARPATRPSASSVRVCRLRPGAERLDVDADRHRLGVAARSCSSSGRGVGRHGASTRPGPNGARSRPACACRCPAPPASPGRSGRSQGRRRWARRR